MREPMMSAGARRSLRAEQRSSVGLSEAAEPVSVGLRGGAEQSRGDSAAEVTHGDGEASGC